LSFVFTTRMEQVRHYDANNYGIYNGKSKVENFFAEP